MRKTLGFFRYPQGKFVNKHYFSSSFFREREFQFLEKLYLNKRTSAAENSNEIQEEMRSKRKKFILLVLGRANCGKTSIINQFLMKSRSEFFPISINLSRLFLQNSQDFTFILQKFLATLIENILKTSKDGSFCKELAVELPFLLGINENISYKELLKRISSVEKNDILEGIESVFLLFSRLKRTKAVANKKIILFLDDIQEMKRAYNDCPNEIHNFFKFLVIYSKEKGYFNVILSTNDSLFPTFLNEMQIQSLYFKTITIDHLNRKESVKCCQNLGFQNESIPILLEYFGGYQYELEMAADFLGTNCSKTDLTHYCEEQINIAWNYMNTCSVQDRLLLKIVQENLWPLFLKFGVLTQNQVLEKITEDFLIDAVNKNFLFMGHPEYLIENLPNTYKSQRLMFLASPLFHRALEKKFISNINKN